MFRDTDSETTDVYSICTTRTAVVQALSSGCGDRPVIRKHHEVLGVPGSITLQHSGLAPGAQQSTT